MPVLNRVPFAPDASSPLKPVTGDKAAGYGVRRKIAAVPDWQPLGHDGIWRVVLHGEVVVRIVRCSALPGSVPHWKLLQMDDMTEEQLDTYEAASSSPHESGHG